MYSYSSKSTFGSFRRRSASKGTDFTPVVAKGTALDRGTSLHEEKRDDASSLTAVLRRLERLMEKHETLIAAHSDLLVRHEGKALRHFSTLHTIPERAYSCTPVLMKFASLSFAPRPADSCTLAPGRSERAPAESVIAAACTAAPPPGHHPQTAH